MFLAIHIWFFYKKYVLSVRFIFFKRTVSYVGTNSIRICLVALDVRNLYSKCAVYVRLWYYFGSLLMLRTRQPSWLCNDMRSTTHYKKKKHLYVYSKWMVCWATHACKCKSKGLVKRVGYYIYVIMMIWLYIYSYLYEYGECKCTIWSTPTGNEK